MNKIRERHLSKGLIMRHAIIKLVTIIFTIIWATTSVAVDEQNIALTEDMVLEDLLLESDINFEEGYAPDEQLKDNPILNIE